MANALGALASLADYGSSMSDDSESESEIQEVVYETFAQFIKDGILNSVVKESVRRVEYAKSINYRNHETIEIDDSTTSSDDESSDSDSDSSDTDSDFLNIDDDEGGKVSDANFIILHNL